MALAYVRGELHLQHSILWNEIDIIYGIAHVHGDHWFAFEIDLVSKVITVVDSIDCDRNWPNVQS